MKLADKAADMKDRVTAAKPWTNSTIPAKQLHSLSTPQPQLSILAAIKFPAPPTPTRYTPPPATFVRPTSRGWLMTLRYSETLSGAYFGGGSLLGISRARFSPLRLIAPHQEARHGHRSCFSWLSGRIHEGQCRRFRLSLKLPFGQISQKSKSPERITSPGFALC